MKVFFAFFLVILVAFVGYHLTFRRVATRRAAPAWFPLTGLEFLIIGLLLGPQFFNILDETTSRSLEPLTALILGWIGLLLGFQFEAVKLRQFPPVFFLAVLIESGISVIVAFCSLYLLLPAFMDISGFMRLITALALSAAAACTAQSGLALVKPAAARTYAGTIRLLRYMASLDGLLPMAVLVMIFFFRPHPVAGAPLTIALQFLSVLVVVFIVYILFLVQRRTGDELALVIIGMTVVTSGASTMMGFSPLIANFFMGICLVNVTREKEKIFNMLVSIEKPVYLLLLVFLGAQWHISGMGILLPAVLYGLVRVIGKTIGGYAAVKGLPSLRGFPSRLGLGMLEQGGLPLAILFDYQQRFAFTEVQYAVGFALAGIVLMDLLSPYCMGRLFQKADG